MFFTRTKTYLSQYQMINMIKHKYISWGGGRLFAVVGSIYFSTQRRFVCVYVCVILLNSSATWVRILVFQINHFYIRVSLISNFSWFDIWYNFYQIYQYLLYKIKSRHDNAWQAGSDFTLVNIQFLPLDFIIYASKSKTNQKWHFILYKSMWLIWLLLNKHCLIVQHHVPMWNINNSITPWKILISSDLFLCEYWYKIYIEWST